MNESCSNISRGRLGTQKLLAGRQSPLSLDYPADLVEVCSFFLIHFWAFIWCWCVGQSKNGSWFFQSCLSPSLARTEPTPVKPLTQLDEKPLFPRRQTHTCTPILTHTHTHTQTHTLHHARTHALMHTRTHTHTPRLLSCVEDVDLTCWPCISIRNDLTFIRDRTINISESHCLKNQYIRIPRFNT